MATVVLVQAFPRNADTAAEVMVRLAGGGSRAYDQLGFSDWRAGVANIPKFTNALGFEQVGFTGGAIPSTAAIRFFPSDKSLISALSSLAWKDARITVNIGDDEAAAPAYPLKLKGIVAAVSAADGALLITFSDLAGDLSKPLLADTFAGTGGIEGGSYAAGRVKRRTWGMAWNIEGLLLDTANNIYEFGDPARPFDAFVDVRDKGRAGPIGVVSWQGSIAATFAALQASNPPAGGAAVAPSIACVKWWTQPSGPLTANIRGEATGGYVQTAPAIAAAIVDAYSDALTIDNLAQAIGWQGATAGIHAGNAGETAGQLLDRLLAPLSLVWSVTPAGAVTFARWTWDDPVETIVSDTVKRDTVFAPLKTRKLGYQLNNRQHGDGEISAAILAGDVTYNDGSTVQSLQPATPDATAGAPTGTLVGDRAAEDLLDDVDFNAESIIQEGLGRQGLAALMDARTLLAGVPVGTVLVQNQEEYRAGDEALAAILTLLGAKNGTGTAFLINLDTVRVSATESIGQRLTSITAAQGDTTGSVNLLLSVVVGPGGGDSRAVLSTDVDGNVGGIVLASNSELSRFGIVADVLEFVDPDNDGGGPPIRPFYYENGLLTIDNAYIKKLAVGVVSTGNIGLNQVTKAQRWSATWDSGISGDTFGTVNNTWSTIGSTAGPATVTCAMVQAGGEITISMSINSERTGSNDDRIAYRIMRTAPNGTVTQLGDALKAGMGDSPSTTNWAWTDTNLGAGSYSYELQANRTVGGGTFYAAKLIAEIGYR